MASRKVVPKKKVAKRTRKPKKKDIDVGQVVVHGLKVLLSGIKTIGGIAVLAAITPEDDIRAAGGSLVDAIGGHVCGPQCWHAVGTTEEERKEWWIKKMEDYEIQRKQRETLLRTWLISMSGDSKG